MSPARALQIQSFFDDAVGWIVGLLDQGMTALLTLIVDPIVSNIQAFTDLLTGFLDKASLATVDFLRTRLVAPLAARPGLRGQDGLRVRPGRGHRPVRQADQ